MKLPTPHQQPISITTAVMALSVIVVITACSPKPSADETAAQTKAIVDQAVEETKKGMLAEQAAEKAQQEEKIKQDAANAQAVAAEKKKMAAARHASEAKVTQRNAAPSPLSMEKITCANCGTVLSITEVAVAGKGSGLGVVAGGVLGGLLGNQVGKGSGRDLATVAGVVGGAVAGNQVEKSVKKTKSYDITVKMETGEERIFHQATVPNVVSGDEVKIENDAIVKK